MSAIIIIYLAVIVLSIVSLWVVFQKAGQPGWGAIIPIYNVFLMIKIAQKPGWWLILYLVPLVNIVIGIIVSIEIARHFGKSDAFGVGLIFLPFIFYPLLAFGDAHYNVAATL